LKAYAQKPNKPPQQAAPNLIRSCAVRLQAKLRVNTPGDIYEQEADRVAARVTSMPETKAKGACACGGGCPKCQNGQHAHGHVHMKSVHANDMGEIPVPSSVNEVSHSSGQPLDASTRAFFEPRFGHDFSRVRVHTDSRAVESARAVNAIAYTIGRNVTFGSGRYEPTSTQGRYLLAHELTHVVQQGQGNISNGLAAGRPDDRHGQKAELAVQTTSAELGASAIRLQRQPAGAGSGVPRCTENPPPTCSICLLPPGGVSWARSIAGPYIVIDEKGGASGAQTEDRALADLRSDPDCSSPSTARRAIPPMPSTKKWWQFWK
jgi:hypothetical protein